jgi:hypothetical protein
VIEYASCLVRKRCHGDVTMTVDDHAHLGADRRIAVRLIASSHMIDFKTRSSTADSAPRSGPASRTTLRRVASPVVV